MTSIEAFGSWGSPRFIISALGGRRVKMVCQDEEGTQGIKSATACPYHVCGHCLDRKRKELARERRARRES
jgi:hypothetical protein